VKPKKSSTLIAEQVLNLMQSGRLSPGDRLPPERQLAEQFEVNRQAVREALSALQLLGVVQTRPGSGTVIAARAPASTNLSSEVRRLDEQDNPFEIMEARGVVEVAVVRLAALRAAPSDLEEIRKAMADYEDQIRSRKPWDMGDLVIHLALARSSGNTCFVHFLESVFHSAGQWLWRLRSEGRNPEQSLQFLEHHRQIYTAIKNHAANEAVRAMRKHLRATSNLLRGTSIREPHAMRNFRGTSEQGSKRGAAAFFGDLQVGMAKGDSNDEEA
jgi:GntR family transcriptional repressor for pyruvate dehydrogenase complex